MGASSEGERTADHQWRVRNKDYFILVTKDKGLQRDRKLQPRESLRRLWQVVRWSETDTLNTANLGKQVGMLHVLEPQLDCF